MTLLCSLSFAKTLAFDDHAITIHVWR